MTTIKQWQVIRYSEPKKEHWNQAVRHSKNGTFLLLRDYMDYHSDRFHDASLLVYQNSKLMALLPGNLSNHGYYSHQGLTYGGLIYSAAVTFGQVETLFHLLTNYIRTELKATSLLYRAIPHIYHRYPAEEDLYALSRMGASLVNRSLSSVVPTAERLPYRTLRRRQMARARGEALEVVEDENFAAFWPVLTENLLSCHGVRPVHTLSEITYLHRCFPRHITLFRVCRQGETVGGCVVYDTHQVAHVQYIAASEAGKQYGALDLLFDYLMNRRYPDKHYFDFGISTEHDGSLLNEGLLFQKEGFGGRAVMYDTYELKL
ncbi:MAG: GNAT family N-acetyltransferase [Prevotellaceae bacterium]|jgi:hypothetical protein|nr:GNAT family N-acetyltransferase [Prevotellaceae bacterium]